MNILAKSILAASSLAIILGFATNSTAQTLVPYTIQDAQTNLNIFTTPEHPKPGEPFVVTLETFSFNLDSSLITFYENGTEIQSARGGKSAQYSNTKQVTEIKIVVTPLNSTPITRTMNLSSGAVSILWQAETITPPFYKGRALYTEESSILLSAVPTLFSTNGSQINAEDIVYTWTVNNTLYLENERFFSSALRINVVAKSQDGSSVAESTILIPISKPLALTYTVDPLYGTNWAKATNYIDLDGSTELTVRTIPYYFGSDSTIRYTWSIDGEQIDSFGETLTLRDDLNTNRTFNIRASIEGLNKAFEKVVSVFSITTE